MTDGSSVGSHRKADSSSVGWRRLADTCWIKIPTTAPFCLLDFWRFMQFWLTLWKEIRSNMRHNGLSDLRHATNVGRISDRPLCRIFNRISFQSVNQNCIKRRQFNGQNGAAVSIFIQVSANRRHLTLEESASWRRPTLEPSIVWLVEASESCHGYRMCLPKCRKHVEKATSVDGFKKKSKD